MTIPKIRLHNSAIEQQHRPILCQPPTGLDLRGDSQPDKVYDRDRSVLFPEKAPWLEDLENELLAFPGRHDDQVDALIQGLAWRREGFGITQSGRHIGMI
jgi:hypothetical protein